MHSSATNVRPKFARAKYFPSGWEADLDRFVALFHRYGYIYRPLVGGTWASANENWALTDTEIIKAISNAHEKFLLGTRAGKTSQFAVLDIDAVDTHPDQLRHSLLKTVVSVLNVRRERLVELGCHLGDGPESVDVSLDVHVVVVGIIGASNGSAARG